MTPETRYIDTFQDGVLVRHEPYIVSDEELADEAEERGMATVDTLIDSIDNLAKAKVFLKRLCNRLIRKGLLP